MQRRLICRPHVVIRGSNHLPKQNRIEQQDHRKMFDELGQKIGVKILDDWYQKISKEEIVAHGGRSLLKTHKGSAINALMSAYPEHVWHPWKFSVVPRGFWNELNNQRKFFDWLGAELGVKQLDDWYTLLNRKVIEEYGGRSIFNIYQGSLVEALKAIYPEHNWIPWKFNITIFDIWKSISTRREFFDELANKLNITKLDDWYLVLSVRLLEENGGSSLLNTFNGSPVQALISTYPDHNWMVWKFNIVPRSFWRSFDNQRKFFDWLGNELGVKELDDWYPLLNQKIIAKHGGGVLLKIYKGSAIAAIKAVYPEHNWTPFKFNVTSHGYWDSSDNLKKYLAELSEKLSIQTLDDWYRVDFVQLRKFGASRLLTKYRGLYNVLKQEYPHHPWDPKKFRMSKKGQRWLAITLKKIFPQEQILEDYIHPSAVFPSSKRPVQLDLFIPSKSLAFEYQGQHHFEDVSIFGPAVHFKQLDNEKREACNAKNIKLIEVPYWWNRTEEGLQEIIESKK